MNILRLSFALFLLLDSLGNVPIFATLLKNYPPKRQRRIILRELLIALGIISVFYFIGDFLLDLIQIQPHTLQLSGGIILFLISLKMIFSNESFAEEKNSSKNKEPFIVPLASPLVAGPAVLAAIMLYSEEKRCPLEVMIALLIAWSASTLILLSSSFLQKILGDRGLSAFGRLMGLILSLIAVQMFLQGLTAFLLHLR